MCGEELYCLHLKKGVWFSIFGNDLRFCDAVYSYGNIFADDGGEAFYVAAKGVGIVYGDYFCDGSAAISFDGWFCLGARCDGRDDDDKTCS